jgi:hypothetical protein
VKTLAGKGIEGFFEDELPLFLSIYPALIPLKLKAPEKAEKG